MLAQVIVEMLHRPAAVDRALLLQNPGNLIHRNPLRRGLAKATVEQTVQAMLSMTIPPAPAPYLAPLAPERPLAHPQYLRRFQLAQLTGANTIQNTLELPHPKIL